MAALDDISEADEAAMGEQLDTLEVRLDSITLTLHEIMCHLDKLDAGSLDADADYFANLDNVRDFPSSVAVAVAGATAPLTSAGFIIGDRYDVN